MININKVKRYSVKARASKVKTSDFAGAPAKKRSFLSFYNSLPGILKAADLRSVSEAVVQAHKKKRAVIFMAGAHVVKCGLNPVLIELIKKRLFSCICLNGAGLIHDFERAFNGKTSEDVSGSLKEGKFGMGRETADFINAAVSEGVESGLGLGYALASKMSQAKLKYANLSLLCNAHKHNLPVCAFTAIGADIIHQHPSFDAGACGQGSLRDFYTFTEQIRFLNKGGVLLNFGSAVILPEVFLKALNLCRNLGNPVKDFVTANFDMIYQYRPAVNVVSRPVDQAGKGYYIIGHHEIMLPLLAQAVMEKL